MATLIGIGLCASAYYIYKNQTNISLHLIRLSLKVEDCFLKIRGNLTYYLIPDEETRVLKYSNDKVNFLSNSNDILLRQAYDIDDKNCDYYIKVFDINKKNYLFIKHFSDETEEEINEDYINYTSPILSCTIQVFKNDEIIYKDYDITKQINSFLNYNSVLKLSNEESLKKLWIYYFNYIGISNNSHISYNNIKDVRLEWTILKDDFDLINGSEININVINGKSNFQY